MWDPCDDVDATWAALNLVEISRDEALLVIVAWQGAPDDVDAGDDPPARHLHEVPPYEDAVEDEEAGDEVAAEVAAGGLDYGPELVDASGIQAPPPPALDLADYDLAPTSIVLEPAAVTAEAPPAPAVTASFDVWTEPAPVIELPRREALSALRDLASELGSLGQAGLSWG